MDAADLDYRARTFTGCIPPHLVSRLLELGHAEEVELQARNGEWFCALELSRALAAQDRQAEALEMLAPYAETGWWTAAQATAALLERWGRVEEAIQLARPHAEAGDRLALEWFARLLARHGKGDEAFDMLRPHIDDWYPASALVEIAKETGRDEEAASLLAPRIETGHRCDNPSCRRRDVKPFNAIELLAEIRERQGRLDEAIALLRTREGTSVNNRDQLADLLARHDRIEELRAYAAEEYHGHAAQRLAELLEERGDVEGAIQVYRHPGDSRGRELSGAVELAQLLVRHGRGDEATEVLRTLADSPGGAEDWIVHMLCHHLAEQGRPEEGLAYLDSLKARLEGEDWEFFRMRIPLMVACGRREEAIELVRAFPDGDADYVSHAVAELLAGAGRHEEAVALLEKQDCGGGNLLASCLIDLGRVKEAVTVLQRCEPRPAPQIWTDPLSDDPPF